MQLTKIVPIVVLAAAGGVLAWVALRAPEPDYEPPAAGVVQAGQATPAELTGDVPSGMLVRSFDVEGMCCDSCTGKLHAALTALPDVNEAAVSFEASRAQVVVPEDVDVAVLVEALNFDKYTATPRQ